MTTHTTSSRTDMEPLTAGGIGALIVTIIGGIVAAIVKLSDNRYTKDKEVRKDTLADYKDLLDRLREDYEEQQKEIQEIRKRLKEVEECYNLAQRKNDRAIGHIVVLEDLLNLHNIKFRAWVDKSDTHHSLPPLGHDEE